MIEDKIVRAKCRNLLKEHEQLIMDIIKEEEQKIKSSGKLGKTEFEIVKDTIYIAGIVEGMKRVLAKINEYALKQ